MLEQLIHSCIVAHVWAGDFRMPIFSRADLNAQIKVIACSGILTFIVKCIRSELLDQRPIKQEYFLLKEVLLIWMKLCSWNIRYLNKALKKFETEQHLDWTWITCQKKGAKNGYSSKPYIGWIFWFVTFCYSAPCISWILGFVTFKCDLHWSEKKGKNDTK